MFQDSEVISAAQKLGAEKDETALEVLLGMRARAIEKDPALADDALLDPMYDGNIMGPLDDLKALGRRILHRWNKELYGLVCGSETVDQTQRNAVLDSLRLGEAAVIAAVASALLAIHVGAAIAAAVAPLIVKRFIWPAKDELCQAWGEQVRAQHI